MFAVRQCKFDGDVAKKCEVLHMHDQLFSARTYAVVANLTRANALHEPSLFCTAAAGACNGVSLPAVKGHLTARCIDAGQAAAECSSRGRQDG